MQPVDTGEQQKIMKLQSEKASGDKKMEWLYTGDKINRDAYLLGKPIDKLLIEKEIDKPKEDVFANTIDLANKIREDPLFEIKKRELEEKKRLLNNPMRLKQIEDQIKPKQRNNYSESDSDNESSRNKKNKYKKKFRDNNDHGMRSTDNSSYRSRDRYDRHHHNDRSNRKYQKEARDYSDDSSPSERYKKSSKKNRMRSKSRSSSRSRTRSRSRDEKRQKHVEKPGYGLIDRRSSNDYHKRSDMPKSAKQLEIEEIKNKIEKLKNIRKNESTHQSETKVERYDRNKPRPKLTDEEKRRRLAEMQDNAKWHENARTKNIKHYKNEDELEKKLHVESTTEKSKSQASHLFNNMMHDAYGSAEDRIKRNRKNLQRNEASFEKNFTKR